MSELRVPTIPTEVQILYADEMHLAGTVFLPALAHRHGGPARPEEWINDEVPFFPFVEPTRKGAILLNKDRVVVLSVAVEHAPPPEDDEEAAAPLYRATAVRVECAGRPFDGVLHIEMPAGRERVQDYLNQRSRFVPLYSENTCHLIRKIHIDRVVELREE